MGADREERLDLSDLVDADLPARRLAVAPP
jgi:hypothetical protein